VPIGNLRTEGDLARFIDAETALTLAQDSGGGTPGGGPPTGPAGGALTGWYPDPDLDAAIAGAGLSFDSNVLSVDGSTGVLTTKGDLLSHNGSEGRLAVGDNTQVLTADSSQTFGLKWADATGGTGEIVAARVWRNVNEDLQGSAWIDLTMNTMLLNEGGMVNNHAVVTVQQDGVYAVSGNAYFTFTGGDTWAQMRIIKQNDEGPTELEAAGASNIGGTPILTCSTAAVELEAGDEITLQVRGGGTGYMTSVNQLPNLSIALVDGLGPEGPPGPPGPEGASAAYSVTIGDNSSTSFNVPHNLGTRDVVVSVREADDPWHAVEVDWEAKTTNAVSVEFLTAPATASMRVTVLSNGDPSSGSYPPKVTELPVSPTDGDEVYFVVEDGLWHLRYEASTERWNFLGGSQLWNRQPNLVIDEGSPYDVWKDVDNPPALTIPLFGEYLIGHEGEMSITQGQGAWAEVAVEVDGTVITHANVQATSTGDYGTNGAVPGARSAYHFSTLREVDEGTVLKVQNVNSAATGNYPSTWFNTLNRAVYATPRWLMAEPPAGWLPLGLIRGMAKDWIEDANPVL